MRILLNGAKDTVLQKILPMYPGYAKYIGWMNTPFSSYNFQGLKDTGLPIACDNGCFKAFHERKFFAMLTRAEKTPVSLEWVTVPDIVGDAKATHTLFLKWYPKIQFPTAYVLQDGAEDSDIPYDKINCVFVGGTTEFKLSETARDLVTEAKRFGKQIHMGRVNTDKRLRYAFNIGCNSVDGTGYVRFRQRELLPALHVIHSEVANLQPTLF